MDPITKKIDVKNIKDDEILTIPLEEISFSSLSASNKNRISEKKDSAACTRTFANTSHHHLSDLIYDSIDLRVLSLKDFPTTSIYKNGNYLVAIDRKDGTKIRQTIREKDDEFIASSAESIDLKITNKCDKNCPFCHENSTLTGKHGNIHHLFIDTLRRDQEIAIGGGNVLEHPDLDEFLYKLKDIGCIPSITINQDHFMESFDRIENLYNEGLIYGIGVSLTDSSDEKFIERMKKLPSAVIHAIVGILTKEDVQNLYGHGLKLLLLGYKDIRRGHLYKENKQKEEEIKKNTEWVHVHLMQMACGFLLEFDNLSLMQLGVKDMIKKDVWDEMYMGSDGEHTFYIDLVEEEFSKSSTSQKRYPIGELGMDEMFEKIGESRKI